MADALVSFAANAGSTSPTVAEDTRPQLIARQSDGVGAFFLAHQSPQTRHSPMFIFQRWDECARRNRPTLLVGHQQLLQYITELGPKQLPNRCDLRFDSSCVEVARIVVADGREALIDAEDIPLVRAHRWFANPRGYCAAWDASCGRRCAYLLHRLVLMLGEHRDVFVDHINGNPLDNRKVNLRTCTRSQNAWNSKARATDKPKGVSQRKSGRWSARLTCDLKTYYRSFDTETEAVEWVRFMREKLHGEFARHG